MADAPDLGSGVLDVWVRIPPRVPLLQVKINQNPDIIMDRANE